MFVVVEICQLKSTECCPVCAGAGMGIGEGPADVGGRIVTLTVALLVLVLAVIKTVVTTVTVGALKTPLLETVPAVADQ